MTPLTERYLAAALRGIPEKQTRRRASRESLDPSIADAIEDRVAAGEDRAAAEKAVLEGLGDPARLAAGMAGRPAAPHRSGDVRRLPTAARDAAERHRARSSPSSRSRVEIYEGERLRRRALRGRPCGPAFTVAVNIFFWVTVIFALIERLEDAREARDEITGGTWTVDRLHRCRRARISASETVGEIITTVHYDRVPACSCTTRTGSPMPTGNVRSRLFNPDARGACGLPGRSSSSFVHPLAGPCRRPVSSSWWADGRRRSRSPMACSAHLRVCRCWRWR